MRCHLVLTLCWMATLRSCHGYVLRQIAGTSSPEDEPLGSDTGTNTYWNPDQHLHTNTKNVDSGSIEDVNLGSDIGDIDSGNESLMVEGDVTIITVVKLVVVGLRETSVLDSILKRMSVKEILKLRSVISDVRCLVTDILDEFVELVDGIHDMKHGDGLVTATPGTGMGSGMEAPSGMKLDSGVKLDSGEAQIEPGMGTPSGVELDSGVSQLDFGMGTPWGVEMDSGMARVDFGMRTPSGAELDSELGQMISGMKLSSSVELGVGLAQFNSGIVVEPVVHGMETSEPGHDVNSAESDLADLVSLLMRLKSSF